VVLLAAAKGRRPVERRKDDARERAHSHLENQGWRIPNTESTDRPRRAAGDIGEQPGQLTTDQTSRKRPSLRGNVATDEKERKEVHIVDTVGRERCAAG